MSSDLQTRDKQGRQVDSSEQYAINMIGDKALQSANYVVKEGKRALEKAIGGKAIPVRPVSNRNARTSTLRQAPTVKSAPSNHEVHTSAEIFKRQEDDYEPVPSEPYGQHHTEKLDQLSSVTDNISDEPAPIYAEPDPFLSEKKPVMEKTLVSNSAKKQRYPTSQRVARHQDDTSPRQTEKNYSPSKSEYSPHIQATDNNLHLSEENSLTTWERSAVTNSLQNQGVALSTSSNSGAALQTFQAAGQSTGSVGASTVNTAASGVGVVIQVTEQAVGKVKETVESITASTSRSSSSWGVLAALFFMPLLVIAAIAGALRGVGLPQSTWISREVFALMPQIRAACENHNITEYILLVGAVIMQESGGRVEAVDGDVMQCAESLGYPAGTPVPVEESINHGVGVLAHKLSRAGSTGPTDIPRISLALQAYNYGDGYFDWAASHGGGYSKENALSFQQYQVAHGYPGGYGDANYVDHVLRYYQISGGGMGDASTIADGRFAYPCPGHGWNTYPGHEGIDIPLDVGEPVYACAAGTVSYTQRVIGITTWDMMGLLPTATAFLLTTATAGSPGTPICLPLWSPRAQ